MLELISSRESYFKCETEEFFRFNVHLYTTIDAILQVLGA